MHVLSIAEAGANMCVLQNVAFYVWDIFSKETGSHENQVNQNVALEWKWPSPGQCPSQKQWGGEARGRECDCVCLDVSASWLTHADHEGVKVDATIYHDMLGTFGILASRVGVLDFVL